MDNASSISQYVSTIFKGIKAKIIIVMKFICFIVFNCLFVSCYTSICNFTEGMDFGSFFGAKDYATYTNERKFVIAIAQYIELNQVEEVRKTFFFLYI